MNDRATALHSVTWLLWAVAATAALQLAPNPLYVAIELAVVVLVVETHRTPNRAARAFGLLLGVAVVFSLLRVALILVTTHTGTTPLVTLPSFTVPRLLGGFAVGGPLEWTVLWSSLAEGFVVIGVMATFGAFNTVASHHELMAAMPRAFHEPGLIVTVALAFVPSTVAAVATVREADRARTGGRIVRRGRSVRLVIPVLETGLERAVGLAESMDSRGFGRGNPTVAQQWSGWLGLGSLVALAGAMIALIGRATAVAAGLGLAGTGCLVAAVLLAPVGESHTRYRPRRFRGNDGLVVAVAALAPIGLGLCAALGDHTLTWAAASHLAFPRLHPLPVLCLAFLAVPVLVPRAVDPADGQTARDPTRALAEAARSHATSTATGAMP